MIRDVLFALRALCGRPGLFAVAAASLGLGIGINVAVFSVAYGALLRPLPYRAPERLAVLWHHFGQTGQGLPAVHPLDRRDYGERSRLFEDLALVGGFEGLLGAESGAELVRVGLVTSNVFPLLGVDPALGRHFAPAEDVPGGPAVVWLGHDLWQRRFAGDPAVVGRQVHVDGQPHEVVGALPRGFELHLPAEAFFVKRPELWRPARIDFAKLPPRNWTTWACLGRLKPEVPLAAAQEELGRIAEGLRRENAELAAGDLRVRVVPLQQDVVKGVSGALWALFGAVGLVLLIACTNVAQLLLARGFGRETELRVRAALGASASRVARGVLAEALVLSGSGALLGIVIAQLAVETIRKWKAADVPRLDTVGLDPAVLAFAIAAAAVSALVSALVPAWSAMRSAAAPGGAGDSRATGTPRGKRLQDRLVVAQLGIAVLVVVGTGLMIRSFRALVDVKVGFEARGLLTLRLALPRADYVDERSVAAFFRRSEERLLALPGVTSVAATSLLPLAGAGPLQSYAYDAETARSWETAVADYRRASPGFFAAMGATLVAGREFAPSDREPDAPRAVIVDRTLVRRAFPGRSGIGERLQLDPDPRPSAFAEVVGVVEPLSLQGFTTPPLPQIYEPDAFSRNRFTLVVRTSRPPTELAGAVQREIAALGPGIAVQDVRPMDDLVSEAQAPARLAMALMSAFGGVSVLLAGIGMYAALACSVDRRRREIGIRLALGATPRGVRAAVLGQGLRLAAGGLVLGAGAAAALGVSARVSFLGAHWADPVTYAATSLVLCAVALLACWIPAERAARVDPVRALRRE